MKGDTYPKKWFMPKKKKKLSLSQYQIYELIETASCNWVELTKKEQREINTLNPLRGFSGFNFYTKRYIEIAS